MILTDVSCFEEMMKGTLHTFYTMADNKEFGHPSEWVFRYQELRPRAMGVCRLATKEIILNSRPHTFETFYDAQDTILHECAHALAGIEFSPTGRRMVHGALWKRWAKNVGAKPNATHVRHSNNAELAQIKRTPNYYYVYISEHGNVQVMGSSVGILKNLSERFIVGMPETKGRMWQVKKTDYDLFSDNADELIKFCFR